MPEQGWGYKAGRAGGEHRCARRAGLGPPAYKRKRARAEDPAGERLREREKTAHRSSRAGGM